MFQMPSGAKTKIRVRSLQNGFGGLSFFSKNLIFSFFDTPKSYKAPREVGLKESLLVFQSCLEPPLVLLVVLHFSVVF